MYLRETKYPGLSNPVPSIPIKSFLTSLEEGSKYGLKLNVSNLKIIEYPDTLVLEMRNMDLEGIEDLLIQTLGTYGTVRYSAEWCGVVYCGTV